MKISNLAFILYSNSSLKWIWDVFFRELEKYFPIECSKYFFTNDSLSENKEFQSVIYKDSDKYIKRLRDCLDSVKEDYVLIHHEDMIFYDDVDLEQFAYYFEILKSNEEFSYIKMLRGGISQKYPEKYSEGVFKLQNDEIYLFTVQPAIWKKSDLIKILDESINNSIYEMENGSSKYMMENEYKCLFAWNELEDKKRGLYHWDNSKYPFIATALVKSKWNDSEYDMEIKNIKLEYDLK